MDEHCAVTCLPSGRTVRVAAGTTLFAAVKEAGLPLGSSCGAVGVCAKCGLQIVEGAKGLSPESAVERALKERNGLGAATRISCQAQVVGEVTVRAGYW
jgi:ferredoxin, 2Fe-2S